MPPSLIFGDINQLNPSDLRTTLQQVGIRRIDTAARYQNGESEKIIGQAKLPQDFTIDTKIYTSLPADGTLSAAAIEKSLTHSLEVLGIESVNVLYCHAPDNVTPIVEQAKAFNEQYLQGRFKYLGVSNLSAEMLQEWLNVAERESYVKPSIFQGQYNLLCRSYEETLFPLLRKEGISFAAFSPLAHGFLLGKYTGNDAQQFSQQGPFGKWYEHAEMHEAIDKLRVLSDKSGLGMDELSMRWLKYHSALQDEDVIILGGSRPAQIESTVAKLEKGPLDGSVAAELDALWEGVRDVGMAITKY